jgi:hypothetical protein
VRRVLGAVLLVLGVALVVLGALARPVLYDRLATVSLDQRSTSVSEGSNMTALRVWKDASGPHYDRLSGVTLRSTREVVGIPGAVPPAERSTTAVWQTGVTSEALGVGDLTYSEELVTFDRTSALTTGAARDERSAGDLDDPSKMVPVSHSGLFYKFPFAVEKKTYPWWDGDLGRSVPISFVREETLYGTPTYVFQQVIPSTEVSTRTVPAAVFGGTGGDVEATATYANTRTLWIEPNTGVIIKGQEQLDKSLASSVGTVATTLGTIGYTDKTVRDNASTWGTKGRVLGFLGGAFMWVGLIAGLVLVALGTVLVGRRGAIQGPRPASGPRAGGVGDLGVGRGEPRRRGRERSEA